MGGVVIDFWRDVLYHLKYGWATPTKPSTNELRAQYFIEAADFLDQIGNMQDCFDDAESQHDAQASFSCARALRLYANGIAQVKP